MTSVKKTILVDQDNCIADFDGAVIECMKKTHSDHVHLFEMRQNFYIADGNYPDELRRVVRMCIEAEGFMAQLEPIEGAISALREMEEAGHDVYICSSPLSVYAHNAPEKYAWVEKHLGRAWVRRLILTKDKTLVRGDVLIDDKPEVLGICSPEWEHVVFDAPYNKKSSAQKRLDSWGNWSHVI